MKVGIKRKKTRTTCAVRSGTLYSGPLPMNISTDFVKKKKKLSMKTAAYVSQRKSVRNKLQATEI